MEDDWNPNEASLLLLPSIRRASLKRRNSKTGSLEDDHLHKTVKSIEQVTQAIYSKPAHETPRSEGDSVPGETYLTTLLTQRNSLLKELRHHLTKEAYLGSSDVMAATATSRNTQRSPTARHSSPVSPSPGPLGSSSDAFGTFDSFLSPPLKRSASSRLEPLPSAPTASGLGPVSRSQSLQRLASKCAVSGVPALGLQSLSLSLSLQSLHPTAREPLHSLDDVIHQGVWEVHGAFPWASVYVGLLTERGKCVSYVSSSPNSGMKGKRLLRRSGDGGRDTLTFRVIDGGKPLFIPDVEAEVAAGRLLRLSGSSVLNRTAALLTGTSASRTTVPSLKTASKHVKHRMRKITGDGTAFLCVPLMAGHRCVGVLCLDGPLRQFTSPWYRTDDHVTSPTSSPFPVSPGGVSLSLLATPAPGKLKPIAAKTPGKLAWSDSDDDEVSTTVDADTQAYVCEVGRVLGSGVDVRRKLSALSRVRDATAGQTRDFEQLYRAALRALRENVLHSRAEVVWSPEAPGSTDQSTAVVDLSKGYGNSPVAVGNRKRKKGITSPGAVLAYAVSADVTLSGYVVDGISPDAAVSCYNDQVMSHACDDCEAPASPSCTLSVDDWIQLVIAMPLTNGIVKLALSVVVPVALKPAAKAAIDDDIAFCKDVAVEMGVAIARASETRASQSQLKQETIQWLESSVAAARLSTPSDVPCLVQGVISRLAAQVGGTGVQLSAFVLDGTGNTLEMMGQSPRLGAVGNMVDDATHPPALRVSRWANSALFVAVDNGQPVVLFHPHGTRPRTASISATFPSDLVRSHAVCESECGGVWAVAVPMRVAVGSVRHVGVIVATRHAFRDSCVGVSAESDVTTTSTNTSLSSFLPEEISYLQSCGDVLGKRLCDHWQFVARHHLSSEPTLEQASLRYVNAVFDCALSAASAGIIRMRYGQVIGSIKGMLVDPDRDPNKVHGVVDALTPQARSPSPPASPKSRKKSVLPQEAQLLHGAKRMSLNLGSDVDESASKFLQSASPGACLVVSASEAVPVLGSSGLSVSLSALVAVGPAPNPFHHTQLGLVCHLTLYFNPVGLTGDDVLARASQHVTEETPLLSEIGVFIHECFTRYLDREALVTAALSASLTRVTQFVTALFDAPVPADVNAQIEAAESALMSMMRDAVPRCRLFIGLVQDCGDSVVFSGSTPPCVGSHVFRHDRSALFHCVDAGVAVPFILQANGEYECDYGTITAVDTRGGCDVVFAPILVGDGVRCLGVLCAERCVSDCTLVGPDGVADVRFDVNFTPEEDQYFAAVARLLGKFLAYTRQASALARVRAVSSMKRPLEYDVIEALIEVLPTVSSVSFGEAVLQLVNGKVVTVSWSRTEPNGDDVGVGGDIRNAVLTLSNADWKENATAVTLDNGCGLIQWESLGPENATSECVVISSLDAGDYSLWVRYPTNMPYLLSRRLFDLHKRRIAEEATVASQLFMEAINTMAVMKGKRLERTYQLKKALEAVKSYCEASFVSLFKTLRLRRAVRVEKDRMASEAASAASTAPGTPSGQHGMEEGDMSGDVTARSDLMNSSRMPTARELTARSEVVSNVAAASDTEAVESERQSEVTDNNQVAENAEEETAGIAPEQPEIDRRAVATEIASALMARSVDDVSSSLMHMARKVVSEVASGLVDQCVLDADAQATASANVLPMRVVTTIMVRQKRRLERLRREKLMKAREEAEARAAARAASLKAAQSALDKRWTAASNDAHKTIAHVVKCVTDMFPGAVVSVYLLAPDGGPLKLYRVSSRDRPGSICDTISCDSTGVDIVSRAYLSHDTIIGLYASDGSLQECSLPSGSVCGKPSAYGSWLCCAPLGDADSTAVGLGVLVVERPLEGDGSRHKYEAMFLGEDSEFISSSAGLLGTNLRKAMSASFSKQLDASLGITAEAGNAAATVTPADAISMQTALDGSVLSSLRQYCVHASCCAVVRYQGSNAVTVTQSVGSHALLADVLDSDALIAALTSTQLFQVVSVRNDVFIAVARVSGTDERSQRTNGLESLPHSHVQPNHAIVAVFPPQFQAAPHHDTYARCFTSACEKLTVGYRTLEAAESRWSSELLSAIPSVLGLCASFRATTVEHEIVTEVLENVQHPLIASAAWCRVGLVEPGSNGSVLVFTEAGGQSCLPDRLSRDSNSSASMAVFGCTSGCRPSYFAVDDAGTFTVATSAVQGSSWVVVTPILSSGAKIGIPVSDVTPRRVIGVLCVERQSLSLHSAELEYACSFSDVIGSSIDTARYHACITACDRVHTRASAKPDLLSVAQEILVPLSTLLGTSALCGVLSIPWSVPASDDGVDVKWLAVADGRAAPDTLPKVIAQFIVDRAHQPTGCAEAVCITLDGLHDVVVHVLDSSRAWEGPVAFLASASHPSTSLVSYVASDIMAVSSAVSPLNAIVGCEARVVLTTVCEQALQYIQRRLKVTSCFYCTVDSINVLRFCGGTHVRVNDVNRIVSRDEYPEMFLSVDSRKPEVLADIPWERSSPSRRGPAGFGSESPTGASTPTRFALTPIFPGTPLSPTASNGDVVTVPIVSPAGVTVAVLGVDLLGAPRPAGKPSRSRFIQSLSMAASFADDVLRLPAHSDASRSLFSAAEATARAAVFKHRSGAVDVANMTLAPQSVRVLLTCVSALLGLRQTADVQPWSVQKAELEGTGVLMSTLQNFTPSVVPAQLLPTITRLLNSRDISSAAFTSSRYLSAMLEWCVTVVLWLESV